MKKPAENKLSKLTEGFDKLLIELLCEDLRQLRQVKSKAIKFYFHTPTPYHYFKSKSP